MTLNPEELVQRASELRPLIQSKAAEGEANRQVSKDVIDAVREAQLFASIAPKRWGGLGLPLTTQVQISEELARGDGSVGWVHYILSFDAWTLGFLPDHGQDEVFADGVPLACGVAFGPSAIAHRTDGGYLVTGRWPYASGSGHSQYAAVGAATDDEPIPGQEVQLPMFVVPMSEATIEDTWFTAGMAGSGSNTVVLDNVFVPDHRILKMSTEFEWIPVDRTPSDETSDWWAFWPTVSVTAAAPLVGMAQAVLDLIVDGATKRGIVYSSYTRQVDSHVVLRDIGDAAAKIESARALLDRAAARVDRYAADRKPMPPLERARIRGEASYISRLLRETVDDLMSIGGASGFANSNPLQRYWRDMGMISRHGFLTPNLGPEIYGRALLELPSVAPA